MHFQPPLLLRRLLEEKPGKQIALPRAYVAPCDTARAGTRVEADAVAAGALITLLIVAEGAEAEADAKVTISPTARLGTGAEPIAEAAGEATLLISEAAGADAEALAKVPESEIDCADAAEEPLEAAVAPATP